MTWREAAQARCDAATAGPWLSACPEPEHSSSEDVFVKRPDQPSDVTIAWGCAPCDARHIAHARTDLPRALALLAAAEEIIEEAVEARRLRQIEHEEMWHDEEVARARAFLTALRAEETR